MQINGKNLCDNCFRELTTGSCDYCAKKIKFVSAALPQGTVIFDRYVIGKPTEESDSAIKYYAYDMNLNKRTLIKEYFPEAFAKRDSDQITVIPTDNEAYTDGLERFFDEARALSDFKKCPGIIKIYKFFNQNETSYYATELLDGYDLDKYLKKLSRKIPETAAVKIIIKTIDALEDIHEAEPCHGQLSPSDIFLCSNGSIKLSTVGGAFATLEKSAEKYAPIERKIKNYGRVAASTDVYSLGVIMLQMITGAIPSDSIARLENDDLDLSGISDQLEPVLRKMLEILPLNRYQSLAELKEALSSRLTIKRPENAAVSPVSETATTSYDNTNEVSYSGSQNDALSNEPDYPENDTDQGNESSANFENIDLNDETADDEYDDYSDSYDDSSDIAEYDDYDNLPEDGGRRSAGDTRLLLAILYSLLGALIIFLIMVAVLLFA